MIVKHKLTPIYIQVKLVKNRTTIYNDLVTDLSSKCRHFDIYFALSSKPFKTKAHKNKKRNQYVKKLVTKCVDT